MPAPTTSLDQTYRVCNPDKPLRADETDYYVDLTDVRGIRNIAESITRRIRRSEDEYLKLLFTGHRGSGKSTELLQLQRRLMDEGFFTIYLDVEEQLDLVEVTYIDILLALVKQIEESLREQDMALSETLLNSIAEWFEEKVIEKAQADELKAGLSAGAEAGAKVPFLAKLLANFTAEIKTASSRRITTRQTLERELAVFIDKLNTLIRAARSKVQAGTFKDIVLIVDGLEKMHFVTRKDGLSSHAELFVHHSEQLKAPDCHIIYTLPISLVYNANLGNDYESPIVLPLVRLDPQGIAKLESIIDKRVDVDQVFSNRAQLERLVRLSGGVIRDLMRLVRLATDNDHSHIQDDDIEYACNTLSREYDRLVRQDDVAALKWVKTNRRVQADERNPRLLNLRLILEYQNGERWAALHPALERITWLTEAMR
ncbi:MAG: hypothetical protein ACRD82_00750 [Blastocatellia bacterium]